MVAWWSQFTGPDQLLVLHGGSGPDFEGVDFAQKLHIDDARLRTVDHQREMQSYTAVLQIAAAWLRDKDFSHVYLAEWDHLPLVKDFNQKQVGLMQSEGADLLGHHLLRVDGTNQPHYLYHLSNPSFRAYWPEVTCRNEPSTVLSMFGSGSFWTRECLEAVAAVGEAFPMYLEIFLPTLAHHLGFRVRDFGAQNLFVRNGGNFQSQVDSARQAGAWTIHPLKRVFRD